MMSDLLKKSKPWPNNLGANERLVTAQQTIGVVHEDIIRATTLHQLFAQAAYNDDIKTAFEETYEAHGLNAILDALMNTLVIILARVMGKARESSVSIPTVISLIESSQPKTVLLNEATQTALNRPTHIDAPDSLRGEILKRRNEEALSIAQSRVDALNDAIKEFDRLKGNHLVGALKQYRNKFVAHLAVEDTRTQRLQYGHAEELLKQVGPLVDRFHAALNGVATDSDYWNKIWRDFAERFWNRLVETPATASTGLE